MQMAYSSLGVIQEFASKVFKIVSAPALPVMSFPCLTDTSFFPTAPDKEPDNDCRMQAWMRFHSQLPTRRSVQRARIRLQFTLIFFGFVSPERGLVRKSWLKTALVS